MKKAQTKPLAAAGQALPHESAALHVSGAAPYVDDLPDGSGTLHAAVGTSPAVHGTIKRLDLGPVAASAGVAAVAAAADVPGNCDIGPVLPGDPLFATGSVEHFGQALFAVAAATEQQARSAARKADIAIAELPAILTIEQALERKSFIVAPKKFPKMQRNWSPAALAASEHRLRGSMSCGAQEHFYLEGQAALAAPAEGNTIEIISSTQHPSEIQHAAAKVLGWEMERVKVQVRRMGGAFGGKETQGAQTACIAALLAWQTGQPVKLRLPRYDDFIMTGKRHPLLGRYDIGFDSRGRITAADIVLAADCGISPDLSLAILDRALFHADNAYHLPCVRIRGYPCRTNKASNTAFRGFGGPQGMLVIERAIEDIARHLGLDPLDVRKANLYRKGQLTPYHQAVGSNTIRPLMRKIETSSDYRSRRAQVKRFNEANEIIKRGLACTPVKFGISFTTTFLNQAGALVHVYRDGSVHLNHGGTEMGQGLMTKVAQIVAEEFGLPGDAVRATATATDKVPNTSATAASAGADMNGKAAQAAARTLRARLARFAAESYGASAASVRFAGGRVAVGRKADLAFAELAEQAYLNRIPLSATGYYRTPKVHYDPAAGRGRPFYYYAYGAAVSEAEIDTLTGESHLLRVDILHDAGASLNPAIDLGQIEGGFIQGLGWLTCEEVRWDEQGRLATCGPATYKIPAAADAPADWRVAFWPQANNENTVFRSKAVGEPPLMLAISAWAALADAVAAASGSGSAPVDLHAPATPESILETILSRRAARQQKAA